MSLCHLLYYWVTEVSKRSLILLHSLNHQMSLPTTTRVKILDTRKWWSALVHAETTSIVYSVTRKTVNA